MASAARTLEPTKSSRAENSESEGRTLRAFQLSLSTDAMLDEIARRMNCDKGKALDFAIALMKVSLDAKDNHMKVGAVSEDKELDTEFKGF